MLAYVWITKDREEIKWVFVLSSIAYAIYFFAVVVFTAAGLTFPLMD